MHVRDFNPHLGNKDDVISSHMGLAHTIAGQFRWVAARSSHIDIQDIVSEAYIGLIKAFHKFDGRVPKFANYAAPMIRWEIQQFLKTKGQSISTTDKQYVLIGKIYRNDLIFSPVSEIVEKLGCSEIEATNALKYLRDGQVFSLDLPIESSDGSDGGSLHDVVGGSIDQTAVHVREFIDQLEPVERQYVEMRKAGERPCMPQVESNVQNKLMAYMGLAESEVNQMSVELTKEKYLELRKQSRSDASICNEFGLKQTAFYRRKKKWGLVGTGQLIYADRQKAANNGSGMASSTSTALTASGEEDWKAKYHALAREHANYADSASTVERLKQELGLLKDMLKFYLDGGVGT